MNINFRTCMKIYNNRIQLSWEKKKKCFKFILKNYDGIPEKWYHLLKALKRISFLEVAILLICSQLDINMFIRFRTVSCVHTETITRCHQIVFIMVSANTTFDNSAI